MPLRACGEGCPLHVGVDKRRVLKVAGWAAGSVLLVAVVAANVAAVMFGETLESFLSTDKIDVTDTERQAQLARDAALAGEVEGEGLVLLQNRNATLPLAKDVTKVNVFGWGSTQWVTSGSGSGGVAGESAGILDALTSRGIQYNEGLAQMYRDFQADRPWRDAGTLNSRATEFCRLYDPDISDEGYYSQQLLDSARDYSDTAIVVLSRMAGESIDCPREQLRVRTKGASPERAMGRSYLEPSPEEERLVRYVAANYQNVIVLVNSTNAMELGIVEDVEGVDACLLCGATGTDSAGAVVDALWGDVNPSGRTTDTYAYDFSTNASYANAGAEGEGCYVGSRGLYPADGTPDTNEGVAATYDTVRFVDYVEGVYLGYRWYETADAEGYWDDVSNRHGMGYAAVVQYPFGYGLSYTAFDWKIVSRRPRRGSNLADDDTVTTTVRVTNVGPVAGKDVVELYATPPYIAGGIEKPSTELVAFAKTDLLQPGESQDVVLGFTTRDLASYDCYDANHNGFAGYEVERGDYQVELKRDAHTLDDCAHASATYHVDHDIRYETDATTGAAVTNRFTGDVAEAGISIDGVTTGAGIRYLTRADFKGSFPQTRDVDRPMSNAVQIFNRYDAGLATAQDAAASRGASVGSEASGPDDVTREGDASPTADADEAAPAASGLASAYALTSNGALTSLGRELGEDYNDPRWSPLLDRLGQSEMERFVLHGYSNSGALEGVSKPRTKDLDGSSQAASFNQLRYGTGFPSPTVLAQTWDTQLARRYGRAVGMECAMLGIDGWYAPACNLHRSPVGGRNYEYYSEDPLVSGEMAAQTILGSKETGTFCYLKHMVLNEQDSYRDSLYTWLTEQSLRELYLEPFRIAVEEGGATGMMSSYNRIGAIWTGGSRALLTEVLRGEWGFRGSVVTDYSDHHSYMNADEMLRAGGSLYMDGVFRDGSFRFGTDSPNFRACLRRATKDVIYAWLNARAANLAYNDAALQAGTATIDRPLKHRGVSPVLVGISVVDAVAALCVAVKAHRVLRRRARKKGHAGE